MPTALLRILKAFSIGPAALVAGSVAAEDLRLQALQRMEPGLWSLRLRGSSASERICLADGRRLIQLRHRRLSCRQVIVADDPDELTVHYTCPGQGFGRTHLRVESARLVQVESQGIAEKQPFDFAVEARRVGDCGG